MINVRCTATALLFSGRPDPQWTLHAEQVRQLQALWLRLPPVDMPPLAVPALGYRGCALECAPGRHWRAYKGVVDSAPTRASSLEYRLDRHSTFERTLLMSAPLGLLPIEAFPSALRSAVPAAIR